MTAEFKKNNSIGPQTETQKSPAPTKPAREVRKPECEKKHPTNHGKRKR